MSSVAQESTATDRSRTDRLYLRATAAGRRRTTSRRINVAQSKLDAVIALAKRRGFVFQAGEIYGG
ncbi:MAG: hypothetical protein ACTIM8_02400, partial [Brevibacterium aurantiacum]